MTDPIINTDWLKLSSKPVKQRRKRNVVTVNQKELIFEFISENPELVTHSSTKECELELWTELTKRINAVEFSKINDSWQSYWKRWMNRVLTKPEMSLTIIDSKVKKFLNNLGIKSTENKEYGRMNIQEVNAMLKDLEAEKAKLTLEIDKMDCKIAQYNISIKELSREVKEKRKRLREIVANKKLLNVKKRKEEDEESVSEDIREEEE